MLPFDFDYYLPENAKDAYTLFNKLKNEGIPPAYYGGGTELISRGRAGNITFGACIDLKGIKELTEIKEEPNKIIIGAGVVLRVITESEVFPFLGSIVRRIADHTVQNKITLGGNILGGIIYKESVLPLLLCNASVITYGKKGICERKIPDVFSQKLNLDDGELLMQISIEKTMTKNAWYHKKFVKTEKIDYPLLTVAAMRQSGEIKYAVSGLYNYPTLIDKDNPDIADGEILNDHIASASYRKFVLFRLLCEAEKELTDG